jgi:hypothetical protein
VKLGAEVVLCDSFPAAMELADVEGCRALVAAGYLDEHDSRFPAWVDLHFGFRKRLKLAGVWESSTKEMCIAVRRDRFVSIESVRSVALHRSTRSLVAGRFRESTEMQFVRAKPLAVQQLVSGQVDACVGSVDVVSQHDELTVVDRFTPSMVWCLYEAIEDRPGFKPALASLTAAAG